MEKKSVIGIGILALVLVLIGAIAYQIFFTEKEAPQNTNNISYEAFNLEYEYTGNNLWTYTVTGELANPCYTIFVESIVMESYPEQVVVKATITPPNTDVFCAEVIQEVLEEGEFQASENASVEFRVE